MAPDAFLGKDCEADLDTLIVEQAGRDRYLVEPSRGLSARREPVLKGTRKPGATGLARIPIPRAGLRGDPPLESYCVVDSDAFLTPSTIGIACSAGHEPLKLEAFVTDSAHKRRIHLDHVLRVFEAFNGVRTPRFIKQPTCH